MKLKHYSYKSSEHSARPNLLFEVRIDLQDVRSGYRGSDSFLLKTEWDSRDDGVPTPDMVERIDEGSISTLEPPSEVNVPAGVEEKVISHILKYSRQTVWRNPALGIYSSPRESRQEFIQKCREEFLGQRSEKVRNLRELYTHRFGELEKKALESVEQGEMSEILRNNLLLTIKSTFGDFRDSLSRWFVRDDYQMMDPAELDWRLEACPDIHDRLADVKNDLVTRYNAISLEFVSLADQIEPYEISPSHSDIGASLKGILWE